jgi:hypothetical protein
MMGDRPTDANGRPITRYAQAGRKSAGRAAFMSLLEKLLGRRGQVQATGYNPSDPPAVNYPGGRNLEPPY